MNPRFVLQTVFSIFFSSILVSVSGAAEGPLMAGALAVHQSIADFKLQQAMTRSDAVAAAQAIDNFMESVPKAAHTQGSCQIKLTEDPDSLMLYVTVDINNTSHKFELTENEITGAQPGVMVALNLVKVMNGGREFPITLRMKKNRSKKLIEVQVTETQASANEFSGAKAMRCTLPIRGM